MSLTDTIARVRAAVESVPGATFKLNFEQGSTFNFEISGPRGTDTFAFSPFGLTPCCMGLRDEVIEKALRRVYASLNAYVTGTTDHEIDSAEIRDDLANDARGRNE